MKSHAIISKDGVYRYQLTRHWGDESIDIPLVYVMLNPSTADAQVDDATIRVCMGRAKLLGFNAISVVNLFALRSTNPKELYNHPDPVGMDNDAHIFSTMHVYSLIIAAWGTHGSFMQRDAYIRNRCRQYGIKLFCLKKNNDGSPSHPLRIPYTKLLEPYE